MSNAQGSQTVFGLTRPAISCISCANPIWQPRKAFGICVPSVSQRGIKLRRAQNHSSQWKRKTYSFLQKIREHTKPYSEQRYDTYYYGVRVTETNENLHSIWAYAYTPFFFSSTAVLFPCPCPPQIGEFKCQTSPFSMGGILGLYHSLFLPISVNIF